MSSVLIAVFAFMVVLFPLILIHELGHYWAAKRCGVHVETFSIGFGPQIFGWTDKSGTRWKVAWFFLGGYVKMLGDADITSSRPDENTAKAPDPRSLFSKSPPQRIFVALAGPLMNYIVAFVLVLGLGLIVGKQSYQSIAGSVQREGLAFQAGLREGDRILSVQSVLTPTFSDVLEVLSATPSQEPLRVEVQRQEQLLSLSVQHPKGTQKPWLGQLGVGPKMDACRYTGSLSLGNSLKLACTFVGDSFKVLAVRSMDKFSGPLGIAHQSFFIISEGLETILFFMARLSLGLGLLNILPIPLLDGGSVLLTTLEWIRGKALGERAQNVIFSLALAGLASLFLLLSWQDLQKLL